MNTELDSTTFLAGDFISENAVRGALMRRPRTVSADARGAERPAATDEGARASRPRRLRRWSVADLLARAVVVPPTRDAAH
jgi:hypothetical protein